jgi:ribonucleotide reductase alpha subunit
VNGKMVPHVTDWSTVQVREANRDWDLPLQNCNMSVRLSDEFMKAVEQDKPWVLAFFDTSPPKENEVAWTKTDFNGELREVEDGSWFELTEDGTELELFDGYDDDDLPATYRYAVALTTWEGLRQNMLPNKNQWRDTDYARFYRDILVPCTEKYTGVITARQLWELINENAWNHADPGVVFSGTYERFQPVDSEVYGPRLSNPCSEYVNSAGGSCNLISVNARRAVEQVPTSHFREFSTSVEWLTAGFSTDEDWETVKNSQAMQAYLYEIHKAAADAMEYIAYALEYNKAPVEYIHELTANHFRTVGVGIMGLAEALMMFHIRYGSKCGEKFAAATMSEIALSCWEKSFELAMTDKWKKPEGWQPEKMISIFDARQTHSYNYSGIDGQHARWAALVERVIAGDYASHTCVTSVAPTGTISMISKFQMSRAASNGVYRHCEVTAGIEPPFFWGVGRQDSSGSDTNFHDMYQDSEHHAKPWMMTAMEVTSDEHVLMQAAITSFCCMSVSKTINLNESATIQDVADGYMLAWKSGVPGTSLYRDKCKPMQVLTALECPSGECGADISFNASDHIDTSVDEVKFVDAGEILF